MRYHPLTCKDVKAILKKMGFEARPQKGTSHQHWIKDITKNGKKHRLKVTVDCPKAPFSHDLVNSMASQAGVSKKDFYKFHAKQLHRP